MNLETTLNRGQAKTLRLSIISLCVFALFCVFQPFSQALFSFGCGAVVFGGLMFNLVPLCRTGVSLRKLRTGLMIVAIVFACVILIASLSARLYIMSFLG